MTPTDAEIIITIAARAAVADGKRDAEELAQITTAATRLGLMNAAAVVAQATTGDESVRALFAALSSDEARRAAYEIASAICNADGVVDANETAFLQQLSSDVSAAGATAEMTAIVTVAALTSAVVPAQRNVAGSPGGGGGSDAGAVPAVGDLDAHILDQAILTAALEVLPERLSNIGILPLQLRLVYSVGQRHGQQLDAAQVKDLAATLGIGAAAQFMEGIVRKAFGGLAGSILGGALGSVGGIAAGAAVTFASTYALGHASAQYYAQGRRLSSADMKALFIRFRAEAETLFPTVQDRIQQVARGTNLQSVLGTLRGR